MTPSKAIAFVLIGFLLFTACRKLRYEDTTVEVYVMDIATGEAFNKPYSVGLKELGSDINGTFVNEIDRQRINEEGKVFFEFEARKSSSYDYEVEFYYSNDNSTPALGQDDPNQTLDRITVEKGIESVCTLKVTLGQTFNHSILNKSKDYRDEIMCGIWKHRVKELKLCMDGRNEKGYQWGLWEGWYEMSYFIVSNGDTTYYNDIGRVYNQPDEVTYSQIVHNPDSL